MKTILPFLLLVIFASCKKEEFDPGLTREFSIQSVSNGATYVIKVGLPENYSESQKYGTVYVLDGDDNFEFVAAKCSEFSQDYAQPNVLVVGIGYGNDRKNDYTPTDTNEGDGGAEQFLLFITNELIPELENKFNADTARRVRSILGHSYGGLCAAYAFTNHNQAFGNYILLSPSLWYDDEVMLRFEQENRQANKTNVQHVFMGLGELENNGRMMAPYMAFYQRLKDHYPTMQIVSHLEPHLDHMGSRNPNIEEALKIYFQNQ
jgi:uncharacterized protein